MSEPVSCRSVHFMFYFFLFKLCRIFLNFFNEFVLLFPFLPSRMKDRAVKLSHTPLFSVLHAYVHKTIFKGKI
jgi:hypothetical protein